MAVSRRIRRRVVWGLALWCWAVVLYGAVVYPLGHSCCCWDLGLLGCAEYGVIYMGCSVFNVAYDVVYLA